MSSINTLPAGTRVTTAKGRTGTVSGYDQGAMDGRSYVGVDLDAVEGKTGVDVLNVIVYVDTLQRWIREGFMNKHAGQRTPAHTGTEGAGMTHSTENYGKAVEFTDVQGHVVKGTIRWEDGHGAKMEIPGRVEGLYVSNAFLRRSF